MCICILILLWWKSKYLKAMLETLRVANNSPVAETLPFMSVAACKKPQSGCEFLFIPVCIFRNEVLDHRLRNLCSGCVWCREHTFIIE